MDIVKITRTHNLYRRSVNGAWVGNGSTSEAREMSESFLMRPADAKHCTHFSLGDGIKVQWPDGVTEHAFEGIAGLGGQYAPKCIPERGRLHSLLVLGRDWRSPEPTQGA